MYTLLFSNTGMWRPESKMKIFIFKQWHGLSLLNDFSKVVFDQQLPAKNVFYFPGFSTKNKIQHLVQGQGANCNAQTTTLQWELKHKKWIYL